MRKKIALFVTAVMMSLAAHAQFESGKMYVGTSLSGFDLSYRGLTGGHIGIQGKVGYLLADNVMLTAQTAYEKYKDVPYTLSAAAGARYYIQQNGIYLGASTIIKHGDSYDDFLPSIQVGYAFFVNRMLTIEPEIYYEQSFKNHSDYSQIGLRIGLGIYLFKETLKSFKR
jgi:hypothetical protein